MFKDEKEFKIFVDKLNIDTKSNSAHREKLKKQMLSAFEETSKKHTTGQQKPDLWRIIMKSPFIKIAAAAVVIIGLLLLFLYVSNNQSSQNIEEKNIVQENNDNNQIITPDTNKQDDELLLAKQLFKEKNIAGLSELLNSDFKTVQIQVAEYLGKIGDETILAKLQILADNWDGLEQDNVYAKAISDIKERLSEIELGPEPNEPLQVTKVDTEPNELSTPIQKIKTGVAGIVIDKDTLEPIVGALVSNSKNGKISEVLTDNDGHFILPFFGIIKEERITIKASGYASQESMARIEEGRITEISIKLTRGINISGIVLDPNNEPVSGAQVSISGNRINHPIITEENGLFEFIGINPIFTTPPTIIVRHPLYLSVSVKCQPDSTGKNIYKEIKLKPGVLVFGKVTDPNGKPVSGVTVGNTKSTGGLNSIKCETDNEGMYVLDNLENGNLILWIFDRQFAPYVLNTVLNPNQSKEQIDIQLSAPTEFKGTVLDKQGNPITKAYATIQGYNGVKGIMSLDTRFFRCNEKGEFIIPNMAKEGILEINIDGTGIPFELQKVDLSLGEQVFIVEQLIPGTMYGKVIDAKTGKPVPTFHVKMNASYSGGSIGGYNASWNDPGYSFNSPDGYFDTGGQEINVGSFFRITVSAKGYNLLINDLVPVQPISDNPQRTVFTLEQSILHFGRVISVEGKPIKNAEILFHHNNIPLITEDLPRTTTDSNGIFSIFELGSDFDIMEVRAANYAPDIFLMKEITISEGRLKDIVLNYGANLHGYVYDENGKPVVNANIYSRYDPQKTGNAKRISQIRSNINNAYTDATGYYELSNIPVGKIEVDVYGDQYEQKKFIEIKTGQNLELNFEKDSQTEQKIKTN